MKADAGNLQEIAARISEGIKGAGFNPEQDLIRQVLGIAEEAGEFVGAFRRWQGLARRPGTREEMLDELADVIIVSLVMCERLGEDIGAVLSRKLEKIFSRGWRSEEQADG